AQQFFWGLAPTDNLVTRFAEKVVQRAQTCWSIVIGRSVRSYLKVVRLFLLQVGDGVQHDQHTDDHYEGGNDGESLAHCSFASKVRYRTWTQSVPSAVADGYVVDTL